jgi:hypothetical protein
MPPAGAERWFHTLVVVGAALGGCGGRIVEQGRSTSGAGGASNAAGTGSASAGHTSGRAGGGPTSPDACDFDAEFVCEDYTTRLDCRCDPTRPHDAQACQSPFDFTCVDVPCSAPAGQLCVGTILVGCYCDPSAPRPEDCGAPEQFFCAQPWAPYRGCACNPGDPTDPATCPDNYCCQSVDPRFGCECSCARIK